MSQGPIDALLVVTAEQPCSSEVIEVGDLQSPVHSVLACLATVISLMSDELLGASTGLPGSPTLHHLSPNKRRCRLKQRPAC